jgi:putative FmdB family regulatory protein
MPIYEYACAACGRFELRRSVAQAGRPAACPHCGASAPRRYGPPNLIPARGALARGRERSERSAYEPEVVTAQEWARRASRGRPVRARHRRHWTHPE